MDVLKKAVSGLDKAIVVLKKQRDIHAKELLDEFEKKDMAKAAGGRI